MSFWVILSWILVVILTAINVFVFLKLKQASEQMLKMAFPGARDMNDAMAQMQKMMGAFGGGQGLGGMAGRGSAGSANSGNKDAQLQAAMKMLQNMKNKK
jgi:hypothetical protein